ncbi:hypothetical protein K439DRAFT_1341202 [Ramaria rubella]|nr:hypothetical protein K439DRAFT_1341202 [Ramaria rubella]
MLGVFPTEIILTVLSFLPLRQLHCLPQTSKEWNAFLHDNESSVYHFAAILHGFVSAHTSFRDARASNVPWLDDVQCWKDLCFKFYNRERRWEGNGLARSAVTYAAGESVWHFKIDEEQRTVITTHLDGGLRVSGIEDDRILWFLYPSEVHVYAHCEYASGFLVVTRMGQELEVWRRKRDFQTIPNHNLHTHQQISHSLSRQSELSVSQNDRGAFLPWKIIRAPNTVRALRLVHSTLLVASEAAQEAYLYDLNDTTNWRPKQTISLSSPDSPRALEISYIDLSPRNIFVCSTEDVLVYALDTTNAQASLKFPSQVRVFNELYETRAYRVSYSPDGPAYVPGGTKSSSLQECSLDLTRLVRRTQSDPIRNFHAGKILFAISGALY